MNRLSVVIATKNAEQYIRDCLESIKWADEIIIVDDCSSDKTVEISRGYTKNIFLHASCGDIHQNKNLGIDCAGGEWILSLDDDEVVSAELAREIKEAINLSVKLGYYIPRKNYFLGKWIKGCGWWPNQIIRLFKKGVSRWPSQLHDTPKINQIDKVGYLQHPLIHHSYHSLKEYFEKFNFYTSLLANEEYQKGVRINQANFFVLFLLKPLCCFFRKYFLWKGFQDGFRGLFISFSAAMVIFTTYAKVWEKQRDVL